MRLPPAAASRAALLRGLLALAPAALLKRAPAAALEGGQLAFQPSLTGKGYGKTEMDYSDFERTPSGVLFKDAKKGSGKSPEAGDRVVLDWSGYTIGYFGRPFETKQLRSLDGIEEGQAFLRFEVGGGTVIPALEQGVLGMHVLTTALEQGVLGMHVLTTALEQGVLGMSEGGVRQIVVTRPELGYPTSDPAHAKVGPKPSTFSGQRALDFVLQNQELIDKTLLFIASRQAARDDNLPCKA
jgi:hypothetical protein